LLAHPTLQFGNEGCAPFLAHGQALVGGTAIDGALDLEQGVDPPHPFQRDGRDHRKLAMCLAASGLGDVRELEELAPTMGPTGGLKDRPAPSFGFIKGIVAAIGVGLQDAGPPLQMLSRMLAAAVARIIEHRRRRRRSREWSIVAHIRPTSADVGLTFGQHRHRGVIGVQPLAGKDMGFDPLENRLHHGAGRAHLIGQGRETQGHTLPGVALGLTVERLMLSELLEQNHREQVGAGPATGNDMEGGRCLGDGLAVAAAELLAHMLDHLPLPRDRLQRLGDILAQLREPCAAAARARGGTRHDDALTRQMIGKWLAGGAFPGKCRNPGGFGGCRLSHQLIRRGRRLQLLELQLHLVQQARRPLGMLAVHRASELLDLQLQMRDQGLIVGMFGLRCRRHRLSRDPFGALRGQRSLQRGDVVGRRIGPGCHTWN
jgi:hypothetical protein